MREKTHQKEKPLNSSLFRPGVVDDLGPLQNARLRVQVRDLVDRGQREPRRPVPRHEVARPVGGDADGVDAPVAAGRRLVALARLVLAVPPVGAVGRAQGRAAVGLDDVAVGVEPGLAGEEGRGGGERGGGCGGCFVVFVEV